MRIHEEVRKMPVSPIRTWTARLHESGARAQLTLGEPAQSTDLRIAEAASEALRQGLTHYPPAAGLAPLRQQLAERERALRGWTFHPEQILITNGAQEALAVCCLALLNPGDEVLIPTPCWVSYPELVRMAGGVPVFIPATEETNFIPTNKDIASRVTRRTKAIVITSPSNPNGSVWEQEQLQFVADLAVSHPFFVVSDEIYEKLIYDGRKHLSIAQLGEQIKSQTFLVNGVSKAYAMTGWRIGYVAGPRNVISAMSSFQSQATSNPNSIAQYAAMKALQGDQSCVDAMVAQFEKRRDAMVEKINAIPGLSCRKPQGAFYIMMNIKQMLGKHYDGRMIESSLDFAELLLAEKQVALVPGVAFEAEGYCRLSYAVSMENILEGLSRIGEFVAELS